MLFPFAKIHFFAHPAKYIWPVAEKCVLLHLVLNTQLMKRNILLLALMLSLLMTSCDYFGSWGFKIENGTNLTVYVSYYEQQRSTEDVLPTYEHGDGYQWYRLAETPTLFFVEPGLSHELVYDAGQVSKDWPTDEDTPEKDYIIPLWERIQYVAVGTDTLDASVWAKDKWQRNRSDYTLIIR